MKTAGLQELKLQLARRLEKERGEAKEKWRQLKNVSAPTPGGSQDIMGHMVGAMGKAWSRGAKDLPEEWHGLKVRGPARLAAHELRKALQSRKVDVSKLPPDVQESLKKLNVGVYEHGARSGVMQKVGPVLSKFQPDILAALVRNEPSGAIIIGGKASESPQVLRHEVGHASGFFKKHPRLSTGGTLATRMVLPKASELLAAAKMVRAAKAVSALAHAGTIAEEARAHVPVVRAAAQELKTKGPVAAAKAMVAPVGGLGSYIAAALKSMKSLGRK